VGWDYPDPGQLYDSITDMRTSQVCMRHVSVRTAVRQADLVGRPASPRHRPISLTLPRVGAFPSIRTQD
jgi:hypothetical protein